MKRIFSTPPNENFFSGYYDKSPLDRASTRLLAQRVKFIDRVPVAGDQLEIGYFDFPGGQTFHQLTRTSAWNWQQGCMLQWRGPTFDTEIIYNDIRDNQFVSIRLNLETKEERVLPMAVYSVSSDGKWAVCIDYERLYWFRPGYNYQGIENLQKKQAISSDDGIWLMSLDRGDPKQIIRLGEMLDIKPLNSMKSGVHYLEHLMFNPGGTRFCFLHRWTMGDNGIYSRFYTANRDGTELYLLNDTGRMSHFCWRDDETILGYGGLATPLNRLRKTQALARYLLTPLRPVYRRLIRPGSRINHAITGDSYLLFDDRTSNVRTIGTDQLIDDGHMSFCPIDRAVFVTDTYPGTDTHTHAKHIAKLILFDCKEKKATIIDKFDSIPEHDTTSHRCDLHPKWSVDGKFICIDTMNDGYRSIYVNG